MLWEAVVRKLLKAVEAIVICMMAAVVFIVTAEIALRGVFGFSMIVTEELSRYLMIWVAMMAIALVAADDGHMRITLVSDVVPPRVGLVLGVVSDIVVIAFLSALVYASAVVLPRMASQGTVTLGLNMAVVYAAMPTGGALMLLVTVARCFARIKAFSNADAKEI